MAPRVLVADSLHKSALASLRDLAVDVDYRPSASVADLEIGILDARVLVVRSTQVSQEMINGAPKLGLIIRAGSGVNNIDVEAASKKGVFVANCPGKNADAVAELVLGLMLSLDRRIPENTAALRQGVWNKEDYSRARGLKGRALRILGFGAVGRAVAKRAQAFEMRVSAFSRSLTESTASCFGVERISSISDVFADAEWVSIHLPLCDLTRHLVSAVELDAMRPGAALINTSRADIVDSNAVFKRVASGRLRYGTDVFETEPAEKKSKFVSRWSDLEGFVGTHHIGASTEQAQQAVGEAVVELVEEYLRSGEIQKALNHSSVQRTTR